MTPSGTGSLTSVGLTAPGIFSVSGSPATGAVGTLALSLVNESANTVFAGPSSGGATTPAFRALATTDLPTVDAAHGGTGQTSYTIGDILYASTTTALSALHAGTSGYVLASNGPGTAPSWQAAATGTVTSVTAAGTAGNPISISGTATAPTIDIGTVPVGRGGTATTSYTPNVVVIANGTGTALISGPLYSSTNLTSELVQRDSSGNFAAGAITASGLVSGTLQITGGAPGAGKVLTSDATGIATWQTASASGITTLTGDVSATGSGSVSSTVNKVNGVTYPATPAVGTVPQVTATNTVTYTATPTLGVNATTTGTVALANGAASGTSTTIQPSSSTTTAWTLTLPSGPGSSGYFLQTNGAGVTSWQSVSGSGTVNAGTANQLAYYATSTAAVSGDANATISNGVLTLGQSGVIGELNLSGNTSGVVSINPQATAGTYNFNLPITAGTSGYFLTSGGGAAAPMTWTNPASFLTSSSTSFNSVSYPSNGISGGIPYYSTTTAVSSSALLNQYGVVYGGGAGAAPASTTAGTSGNALISGGGSGAPAWSTVVLSAGNVTLPASGIITNASGALAVTASTNLNLNSAAGGSITLAPGTSGLNVSGWTTAGFVKNNASGLLSGGNSLASSDVTGALGYTPVNKAGDTMGGNLTYPANLGEIFTAGTGSNTVTLEGPTGAIATSFTLRWPSSIVAGEYLTTDASGNLSWGTPSGSGSGTVNSGTANQLAYYASSTAAVSGDANATISNGVLTLGQSGVIGELNLSGNTSGVISINPQATAGTYNFNLPITAGTSGYFLTSGGGAAAPMTWTNPASFLTSSSTSFNSVSYPSSGISGGIPYYSSTSAISSSALLTANQIVLGGGAGAAPSTIGSLGTTTTLLHGNASGAPTFSAVSLTADVSGLLPLANGGSNANLTANNGGMVYSNSSQLQILAGTATAGLPVISGASTTPSWSTVNLGSGNVTLPASGMITNASGALAITATTNLNLSTAAGSTATLGNTSGASSTTINGGGTGGSVTIAPGTLGLSISGNTTVTGTVTATTFAGSASSLTCTGRMLGVYSSGTAVSNNSVVFTGTAGSAPSLSGSTLTLPSNTCYIVVEIWGSGGSGSCSGAVGNAGSSSCFGTNSTACTTPIVSATAGTGATIAGGTDGGPGGTGSGGDINMSGGRGASGSYTTAYVSGVGGASPRGGLGGMGTGNSATGFAGGAYGGGGGGNGDNAASWNGAGGGGGGYASKFINSPSGTYYYTIGTGGAAVSAAGYTSGAGGAGGITITVYQ